MPATRDIRAVVFDCDGVMFDTLKANITYYNDLLHHCGRPSMAQEQLAFIHMHTVDESMAYLFSEKRLLARAMAHRKTLDYRRYLKRMEIEPHLKPLLAALRPSLKTAIATNRTDTMHPLLAAFELTQAFDLVVTAADVARPKPHPEQLFRVASGLDMTTDQLLYIGDSQLDEAAAAAAGVLFVAYGDPDLLADAHIHSLAQVPDLIRRLGA